MPARFLLIGVVLVLAAGGRGAPRPKDPLADEERFRKLLIGDWAVEEIEYPEEPGLVKGLSFWWEFLDGQAVMTCDSGQVEQDIYNFEVSVRGGRLCLDLVRGTGKDRIVQPGIVRVDGDRLIWIQARGLDPEDKALGKDGDHRTRPATFTPKKRGEGVRLVLTRQTEARPGRVP